ncbi:MAG: hypothetical protein ACLFP0_02750 [Rhodosalinus sp.]
MSEPLPIVETDGPYIMIQAIARIEDMSKADGLFAESLCAAVTQTSPDAHEGLAAFLEKRVPRFR